MQHLKENHRNSFDLSNCFGFSENDVDLSLWENSSILNETNAPLEFQPHKPFRLALYVRPVEKRLQKTKASALVKNTIQKQEKNKKIEECSSFQFSEKKETKRTTRKSKVMLFDENVRPENESKKTKTTPHKVLLNKNVTTEVPTLRKNVLKELNTKSLTKTKQNKIRKSYERKYKEKEESDVVIEPPSEEILKELEFKKLSRTKQKKTVKEEQEFEKWANNINSAFDDVDKFELSITYD